MLTESVSDPRRANWLTITSMCEDLCWPDEPSTSRPNWELEAEILRLTTRLMMRERELRQAKNQLKVQTSRAQQQASAWRQRMEEKEEQMKEVLLQKDAEMQNIVSQLLLFEAELRREQSRIEDLLGEKDALIHSQKMEIDRLKSSGSKNSIIHEDNGVSELRREHSRIEDLLEAQMQCKSMEIDRLVDSDTKVSINPRDIGVSAAELRLEQSRIEDRSDPLIKCKRDVDRQKHSNGKISEDDIVEFSAAELRREQSRIEEILDAPMHQYLRRKETKRLKNSDSKASNSSEDSGVVISSSDSCPSPNEMKDELEEESDHFFQIHQDGVFDDPLSAYDSQLAVQKLKDGLTKIRAIQDVTNVKSLDFSYDCIVTDKKRIPYRAPQKMKDLKAKRSINPHKIYRPSVSDINNQVIL